MSLLAKKYKILKPTKEYLIDKVVLAQAWKKAHQYIRSTNWYAETFELDRSAIDLDSLLNEWLRELESDTFKFEPLRIVPAPKTERWNFTLRPVPTSLKEILESIGTENFSHVWQPERGESKPLRPLAHVPIRDQTLMMALMMCLANSVESKQGNTATPLNEVHQKKIVNYGNRLYCHFDKDEANFAWGNTTSYSKYFSDYQKFLERPAYFGGEALQQKIKDEHVFEIHLDIAKFYDCIDRTKLNEIIRSLCEESDTILERLLISFEKWEWDAASPEIYAAVCKKSDETIPAGIPQGLVAGGFLANIYLLDFDSEIQSLIGQQINENISLVDYCRYVDDMRLIIVTTGKVAEQEINKIIADKIGGSLQELKLQLNPDKTRIEKFRYKRAGISTKLRDIQKKVSGPLSAGEIDEQLGHLEGLISLADTLRTSEPDVNNTNPLANIEMPSGDVRDDTLLRFSANKIHTLLKQKRSLFAQEIDENGKTKPGSWDYLQERMARKFIACWSMDPSLVLLLKKGLELFPDKKILKPVLDQLRDVLQRKDQPRQIKMAEYCIGEIFRHTATSIHTRELGEFPAHADTTGFFELLQSFAVEIISND
jgi:hypothetical protein